MIPRVEKILINAVNVWELSIKDSLNLLLLDFF